MPKSDNYSKTFWPLHKTYYKFLDGYDGRRFENKYVPYYNYRENLLFLARNSFVIRWCLIWSLRPHSNWRKVSPPVLFSLTFYDCFRRRMQNTAGQQQAKSAHDWSLNAVSFYYRIMPRHVLPLTESQSAGCAGDVIFTVLPWFFLIDFFGGLSIGSLKYECLP